MLANRWLLLILVAYLALTSLYNLTTPILETPDAVWHYAYVRQLAFKRELPVVDAEGVAPYRHEGLQPPLYYAIGALLIGWMNLEEASNLPARNPYAQIGLPLAGSNDNRNAFLDAPSLVNPLSGGSVAIHILRFYSTLLGAGTVLFTYLSAREILLTWDSKLGLGNGAALLATAFVAFLPQFVFVSASVSNDNLAILLSHAVVWQTLVTMRAGLNAGRATLLGVLVGLALVTKLNTITLIGLVGLGFAYVLFKTRQVKRVLIGGAIFAALILVISGWWYWRNLQLYGDPTTFARLAVLVGERPAQPGLVRWFSGEFVGLRLSSWGIFGWFNILASPALYNFFDILAMIGVTGMGVLIWRNRGLELRFSLLPFWVIVVIFSLWRYSSEIVSSQGRLLFPALSAWAIMWSWGISTLTPTRMRGLMQLAVPGIIVAIAALVPAFVIAPAYAVKTLASERLPPEATPLGAQFENGVEWLGTRVANTVVRPGESFELTIYSRVSSGPISTDALFVHIVNGGNVIVAQRDSFIGSGNLEATTNPIIISDIFRVAIPATAPAPARWQIQAGMYNPHTGERSPIRVNTARSKDGVIVLGDLDAMAASPTEFNFDFDSQMNLRGAQFDRESVAAGGQLILTLQWDRVPRVGGYHVFVHALGNDDKIWGTAEMPVDAETTTLHVLFDSNTPPEVYPLELGVYLPPAGDRLAVYDASGQDNNDRVFLGPIRVTTP